MLRRSIIITLEVVVGLVALVAVGFGILLWRLTSGPVELDFLTPHLVAAFEDAVDNSRAEVGATVLTWQGWDRPVSLSARDVRILDREGQVGLSLPEVAVRLSLRALSRGVVAPTSIELRHADLLLQRMDDGSLIFSQRSEERHFKEIAGSRTPTGLAAFLDAFPAEADPTRPLSYLTRLQIRNSEVTYIDQRRTKIWSFPVRDLKIERDRNDFAGELGFTLGRNADAASVEVSALYDRTTGLVDFASDVEGLNPALLADLDETLAPLEVLDLPLGGLLQGTVKLDGEVVLGRAELTGPGGTIQLPDLGFEPLLLGPVELVASLESNTTRLVLERLSVVLPAGEEAGPRVSLTGEVTAAAPGLAGDLDFAGLLRLDRLRVNDLPRFWTEAIAPDPREWVLENIEGGAVHDLEVEIAGRLPGDDLAGLELSNLKGGFSLDQVNAHYLRPLPPVTGVSGSAIFDADNLSFTLQGGQVGTLKTEDATLIISNLSKADFAKGIIEEMYVDVGISGAVSEALDLLNHPRLDLISPLGIDPAGGSGLVATRLVLRFPLLANLAFDDIVLTANADFTNLGMADFISDADLTSDALQLSLDNDGMRVGGSAKLGGVPLELDWSESFSAESDRRSQIKALILSMDDAGRRAVGVDLGEILQGPISAEVLIVTRRDGGGELTLAANLESARFALPEIDWEKPAGRPGSAHLTIALQDFRAQSFDRIDLEAGDLRATGRGLPGPGGTGLAFLDFDRFSFPAANLEGLKLDWRGEALVVSVAGGEIDAEAFLEESEGAPPAQSAEAPPAAARTPFTLLANHLAALRFGKGRWLEEVTLALEQSAEGWRRIYLDGQIPEALRTKLPDPDSGGGFTQQGRLATDGLEPEPPVESEPDSIAEGEDGSPGSEADAAPPRLVFEFSPDEEGGQRLMLRSNDMGGTLRALDLIDTIHGGELEVKGRSDGPLPYFPLEAKVRGRDFRVVKAPMLARLLTIASITAPLSLIEEEGLVFKRLIGDFTLHNGLAKSELIRAYGNALGLTAKGQIDFEQDISDFQGTVVPAYTVNRVLGELPLLGPILTGGEGEGVFAVTYKASGPVSDLKVAVNALSALAPGFLRGLFVSDGNGEGEDAPRALPDFKEDRDKK